MINPSKLIIMILISLATPIVATASEPIMDKSKELIGSATMPIKYNQAFMPENTLHLQKNIKNNDIDETVFNNIIDKAVDIYTPLAASHGTTAVAYKYWNDDRVNAYGGPVGDEWQIHMYGGLARRPEITPDGFALVVCHEIGHSFGGFPFYGEGLLSSEGQSDYFAAQSCARLLWSNEDNSRYEASVHPTAKEQCNAEWNFQHDRNLCYRTTLAGQSISNLLATLENKTVSYDTPDTSVVSITRLLHAAAQCRLDTYLQAALCNVNFDPYVLPGKNATNGHFSLYAEKEAALQSCTRVSDHLGVPGANNANRPRCWYAPQLTTDNIPE